YQRFEADDNLCELTGTTSLFLVGVVYRVDLLANGFAVGDLWFTNGSFNLEFALHAVDQHVEVQFAHAADFSLAGFFVLRNGKGWVFCRQTLDSGRQFFLVTLGVWLNSNRDHWFWEFHGFQD